MIANYLSAMWRTVAPALGNHLWQSTLFAIAAGLLTLILRKNHARSRYCLWLAASMKFLIPFSLLIGLGSHLAWSRGSAGPKAGFYIAMEEVGQPFTQPAISVISPTTPATVSLNLLPALLAAVWFLGFLTVVFVWYLRWRRVSIALRDAEPLREGRELETLRRLERLSMKEKGIEMFLSRASLEPGIFGIVRPVLVWPKGISERLEDAHLDAILAHELWHVHRHDNLAATLHMLAEAIFWFHPLVWWLGSRLVEERERACDEAVLESGSDRQVYAESILKICEFCVGSPLACVSGVTGADLKKRMVHIMTKNATRKLDFSRKLLLSAAGLLAVAAPVVFGLLQATQTRAASQAKNTADIAPAFETASIKPNNGEPMAGFEIVGKPFNAIMWKADRLMATNFTLHGLIRVAYAIQAYQISGGPDWLSSEGYDIDAKIGKSALDEMQKRGRVHGVSGRTLMLQALLSDRFKLKFHHETRELPVYVLVIPKSGPKIQQAKPGDTYPDGLKCSGGRPCGAGVILAPESGKLVGQGVTIPTLVEDLSSELGGRIVVDKTGLAGNYDFALKWKPDGNQDSMLTALQDQLGLKLETQKLPIDVLVIDHAEMPSEPQAQNDSTTVPPFEDVSIKLNKSASPLPGRHLYGDRFNATSRTIVLIRAAYGPKGRLLSQDQVSGGPDWIKSEMYNINAKVEGYLFEGEWKKLSFDEQENQVMLMLRSLLADQFKLRVRHETRELPVYVLVLAKNGPKFAEDNTHPEIGAVSARGAGKLEATSSDFSTFADVLSILPELGGRTVLDKTGLQGHYSFTFQWTPENSAASGGQSAHTLSTSESPGSSLFAALQEQLGLKMELQKVPVDVLVIDSIEKPSEN
jgi:bla regulator protein BlaR1